MPWSVVENGGDCGGDTPWAVLLDDDGSTVGCYADEETANAALDALNADEPSAKAPAPVPKPGMPAARGQVMAVVPLNPDDPTVTGKPMPAPDDKNASVAHWSGTLVVEGIATGDGRQFEDGSLTWGTLPIPLRWLKDDSHGGMQVNGVVSVGRIDSIQRVGNQIQGAGVIDLGSPDGREAARRMGTQAAPGFLSGVSIDADDPSNGQVEYVFPSDCPQPGDPAAEGASVDDFERCMMPEKVIYHSGRIRAATLCDIPAFVEAQLYLTEKPDMPEDAPPPSEETVAAHAMLNAVAELTAAAYSISVDDLPPAAWFLEPEDMPEVGAITITDDGRIFGYLAPKNVAHRGYGDRRVTVPLSNVDYSRWMNRQTLTLDGRIVAGPITMDCGHASVRPGVGAHAALEHYDNACSIVATARVGENRHGVWLAGALLPGINAGQVARLLACQLSGDWRPHRERPGFRELCGVLAVPVPGFPVAARSGMRITMNDGELVASAVPFKRAEDCGCSVRPGVDLSPAAEIIARSVGRDRKARLKSLVTRVKG